MQGVKGEMTSCCSHDFKNPIRIRIVRFVILKSKVGFYAGENF